MKRSFLRALNTPKLSPIDLKNIWKSYIVTSHDGKLNSIYRKISSHLLYSTQKAGNSYSPIKTWQVLNWMARNGKYLGLHLDKRLTFREHVEKIIDRATTVMRISYPLICRKSYLNLKNKLLIYKAVIRPVLTYGFPIFQSAAATHLKKLQTFQNKIIKTIMNRPPKFYSSKNCRTNLH